MNVDDLVAEWSKYLKGISDWQSITKGIKPRNSGCGILYEIPNPIDRSNESIAIADMRKLEISEPHKHTNGEVEVYFILQGTGKIAFGNELYNVKPHDVIVIPPETIHISLPGNDLVLAAVNTPPFDIDNYVVVSDSDEDVIKTLEKLHS